MEPVSEDCQSYPPTSQSFLLDQAPMKKPYSYIYFNQIKSSI